MGAEKDPLKSKLFHSYKEIKGKREMLWQGEVLECLGHGYYLVRLFDWLEGRASCQKVVHLSDMKEWDFYASEYDFYYAYYLKVKIREPWDEYWKQIKKNKQEGM